MTNLSTIKQWFRNGLKPTQEQFWAWMDSYWHKDEEIPQSSIKGLDKTLENKAETTAVDAKANKDATGLGDDNVAKWKEALGVGELPSNIAKIDEGDKVGNAYNKEQVVELLGEKLDAPSGEGTAEDYPYVVGVNEENESIKLPAGDLGKNLANSKPTSAAGAGLNMGAIWDIDTNGFPLRIKGLADKSAYSTFNKMRVQDENGVEAWSNGKIIFQNLPNLLSVTDKVNWMKQWSAAYSSAAPRIDSIIMPIIEKGGIQEINIFGVNLSIDPEISHIRIKQKSNVNIWHSAESFTNKTSNNISLLVNTDNLSAGEEYVVELKHGVHLITSSASFNVVTVLNPIDIRDINWQQANDIEADTYNRVTRNGNSFFVENLKGASAESGYRNKTVRRYKSNKVLSAGENGIFSFSCNIDYSAGVFEFPKSDFDKMGVAEFFSDETISSGGDSMKCYFQGGGKPINLRTQSNQFIQNGNGNVLIIKKGTVLICYIQAENSIVFNQVDLIKDIDISIEFQTVARYLNAKAVGTYRLDSIYKF